MATIEVSSETKISIYEMSDRGHGLDIEVGRDEDGRWGIWVGARGEATGRCLGSIKDGALPRGLAEAMTEVGEAEGWKTVKVNGSVVWSSEATTAVKEALELPEVGDENDVDELGIFPEV